MACLPFLAGETTLIERRFVVAVAMTVELGLGLGVWGACAHAPSDSENVVIVNSSPNAKPNEQIVNPISPASQKTAQEASEIIDQLIAVTEKSLLVQNNLDDFNKIEINVPFADIQVEAGLPRRQTALRIQRLEGGDGCRIRIVENDTELKLSYAEEPQSTKPAAASAGKKDQCRFGIDLRLHEAAALGVDVRRGGIMVERWKEPVDIKMESGDIDLGDVGPVSVVCGKCTLAGDGVTGALKYTIEQGNVGLAGLVGGAEGKTLGDTILKWKSIRAGTKINVVSRAGDIYLVFPKGTPLSTELKAPKGDVDSRFKDQGSGIPVSVQADLGNVRVLPAGP